MTVLRGGNKLDAALAAISSKVSKAAKVRVGFLEGATYPDGTPVAMVAALLEFGTAKAGPWPFFRNMIAEKSPEWDAAVAANLRAHNWDAALALTAVGEGIAGQLRQSIIDTNSPPLSPKTVARKGSAKPLVDTSHLLNSVDQEVVGR